MIAFSFVLSICLLWTGVEGQSSGDLRLVARDGRTSSTLTAGRLEVYYNGRWGTVCDDNFGATEARIACRQLGFSGYYDYETIGSTYISFTASSSAQIWLDSLSCSTFDSSLISCASSIGTTDCSHFEDVALYCLGDGALRLSNYGSYDTFAGRVEVYYNGRWGTVCNDFFGLTEANVACQQLGYGTSFGYGTVGSLGYSQGSGTIWLDNVDCSSSTLMLSSCSHNGFGNNNCFHSEDVAVSCSTISTSIFTTAVIVGIVIAVLAPLCCIGICVTIIIIAVCTGACAAGASSRRGRRNVTTTTAVPPATTAVVTSTGTSSQQTAAGFTPQAGYAPYPANLGKKEMEQYPGGGGPAYPPQGAPPYPTSGYAPVNP